MDNRQQHRSQRPARSIAASVRVATAVAAATFASVAMAALGGPATSIAEDRHALAATAGPMTPMPAYERHEMTTSDGTSVREFATTGGDVFAVDFTGPTLPDLRTLLGVHYDDYVTAAQARRGINRHAFSFERDGLVFSVIKLPRGFVGHAHLPAAVPAGVDIKTLR